MFRDLYLAIGNDCQLTTRLSRAITARKDMEEIEVHERRKLLGVDRILFPVDRDASFLHARGPHFPSRIISRDTRGKGHRVGRVFTIRLMIPVLWSPFSSSPKSDVKGKKVRGRDNYRPAENYYPADGLFLKGN